MYAPGSHNNVYPRTPTMFAGLRPARSHAFPRHPPAHFARPDLASKALIWTAGRGRRPKKPEKFVWPLAGDSFRSAVVFDRFKETGKNTGMSDKYPRRQS